MGISTTSEERKKLATNFLSLYILQAVTYILPLLTMPYLVRVIGIEKYGLVMFAQSFMVFFNIFVDFGFNLSATREVSINRNNKEKLTEIFSSVLTVKIILVSISLIILLAVLIVFDSFTRNRNVYLLSFIVVVGQALFPVWYFQGLERMKYITFVNVSSKILFTIAIFVFIRNENDYLLFPLFYGLGFLFGGMYSIWIVYTRLDEKFYFQSRKNVIHYFKESAQFFLSRLSVSFYTSANTFVLGIFTNNTMVGFYSVAEKLYLALQGLYQPVVQTLYPYIAKKKNIYIFRKLFKVIVFLNLLILVFLFFFGSNIFALLFSKTIGPESIKVFKILLLAAVVVVPSILLGYPLLGGMGYTDCANRSVIIGSVFHIFAIFLLVLFNYITIYNVAIAVIITELTILGMRLFWISEYKLLSLSGTSK